MCGEIISPRRQYRLYFHETFCFCVCCGCCFVVGFVVVVVVVGFVVGFVVVVEMFMSNDISYRPHVSFAVKRS